LNSTGAVMGTIPYMSPEQLRGKPVDARTDIFSVGALLYEMLAGKPAFNRDNNAETIASILNDEPDWSAVPRELVPILQKCLAKDVAQRYSTADELLPDLRERERAGISEEKTSESKSRLLRESAHDRRRTKTEAQFLFLAKRRRRSRKRN
jgi:serine/threonine protein kinase